MDVDDNESVAKAIGSVIESEGRVDVLVNNAGVGGFGDIEATPLSVFTDTMNTNVWGVLRCTQAVLPTMRKQRSGCIVTNTSAAGRVTSPGFAPYSASKWAAEAVCETLAMEVAGFDIRVAIIEPGVIATPIFEKAAENPPDLESPYLDVASRMGASYSRGS